MWSYTFLEARTSNLAKGQYGAGLEVRYRLNRIDGTSVPLSVNVQESIRVLVDTHKIAGKFKSGPDNAKNGFFNDLYRLVSSDPLPHDFRFEIEQTYTANNEPVSGKNKIVYTPSSVLLYGWEKERWKLWGRGSGRS